MKNANAGPANIVVVRTPAQVEEALSVRRAVFIEEQGVPEEEEIDAYDGNPDETEGVVHVVAYLDGRAVATGRLLTDEAADRNAQIGRVAVLRECRGRGLGKAVMRALQEEAGRRGYGGITVAAQLQAIPFYESLGYSVRGGVFLDAGIEHRWMDLAF